MVKEWICKEEPLVRADEASVGVGFRRTTELVRCKDCKNWVGNGVDIDKLPYWFPCKDEMRQPEWFCADGERRDYDD